ncbi:hypothetical protein [Streptomyces cacaoi]
MSRETDSSSSGPHRRGGSAYPSGTEPYGASGAGVDQADQGTDPAAGAKPDEPKTETTLTTRIRINIPGSRPIPPVVMRTPVSDDDKGEDKEKSKNGAADADSGSGAGSAAAGRSARASSVSPASLGEGAAATAGSGAPAGGGTVGDGLRASASTGAPGSPGGPGSAGASSPSGSSAPSSPSASASSGRGNGQGGGGTSGKGEQFSQGTSDWFAPRKPPRSSGSSASSGASSPGGSSGSSGSSGASVPAGAGRGPEETAQMPAVDADGSAAGTTGETPFGGGPFGAAGQQEATGALPLLDPSVGFGGGPDGPTTGPATGDMNVPPVPGTADGGPDGSVPGSGGVPGPLAAPDGPGSTPAAGTPAVPEAAAGRGDAPAGSTLGLGTGPAPFAPDGPGTALYGDDGPDGGTAAPGAPGGTGAPASGKTMVSGVPSGGAPDAPAGSGAPAGPGTPAAAPSPAPPAPAPPAAKKGKGGRNKLVLAGAAVVGIVGVAYGTGLLLDHADVPKGTTVLGVDIGGLSKHEATNKLKDGLGARTTEPFTVVATGQKAQLKPSVAGLTFDTDATVRNAAGRDYNPVSVIGSLFGQERKAEPAVKVDEAKMRSALRTAVAQSGDGGDGMVTFKGGKARAVKGKPHQSVDMDKAPAALEEAFRKRATTGKNEPVELPVSGRQQPKFSDAELQQAVNGFGRTAMSGWVWLKAGDVKVPFSQKTIGTFLTMVDGGGKLQPHIDTRKLKATYGNAFDNVVIEGGAGTVKMTPRHAAAAMMQALREKAPPEPGQRVAEVPGARSQ